jgi:DNA-binding HxlR family transcriptional regulator
MTAAARLKNSTANETLEACLERLDDAIHQKVRLGAMSTLMAQGETDFNFLKTALNVSDGNLSTHLSVLENHGYIAVRKEFVGKRPRTTYTPTPAGRKAFEAYIATLEMLVRSV